MTGTTTRGLPYPQITDTIDGLAGYIQSLAEAVDTQLGNLANLPYMRLVAQATQSLAHNTIVPIQFGTSSEEADAAGWHSESVNNSRCTPNIAGIYEFTGSVAFGNGTDYVTMYSWFRKNGSTAVPPAGKPVLSATQVASTTMEGPAGAVYLPMNGSTDYVELCAQHTNGASASRTTGLSFQFASVFQARLVTRT